ncbi:hypothetical protein Ancab_003760 [Ancistrocladus abbreviatus]
MGLNSPLLSLDLNPPYVPQAISEFLPHLSFSDDTDSDKLSKLNDYIRGLQDELRKIEAFKREFPLSLLLLKDVIDYLKEEAEAKKCREKELTSLKNNSTDSRGVESETDPSDKKNWMSSAQLWSTNNHSSLLKLDSNEEENDRMESDNMDQPCKYNYRRGAFPAFKESSSVPPPSVRGDSENLTPPVLSLTIPSLKNKASEPGSRSGGRSGGGRCSSHPALYSDQFKSQPKLPNPSFPASRKQRRSWSPELHRRFLDALERLGGSQVATPKQIRDLMQVDGLTNDEVKSHLQKYRLHIRKFQASSPTSSNEISPDQVQHLEGSSKADIQQSGSPDGPLQLTIRSAKCCNSSATCGDSIEEDQKSDGHNCWKIQHQ